MLSPRRLVRGGDRARSNGGPVTQAGKGTVSKATHLDGLSIVHFDHVEAEAINPFSRGYEYTGGEIEMVANIY